MKSSKWSLGLKAKTALVFAAICLTVSVSGGIVLLALADLNKTLEAKKQFNNSIAILQESDLFFADANLLAMDMIVDRYEDPAKSARRGEFNEFTKKASQFAQTKLAQVGGSDLDKSASELNANLTQLVTAISGLLDAIDRGEKSPDVFAKFDDEIDGAKESAAMKIDSLRSQLLES